MANLLPPLKPIPIKERLSVLYIEKGHLDAPARGDEPRRGNPLPGLLLPDGQELHRRRELEVLRQLDLRPQHAPVGAEEGAVQAADQGLTPSSSPRKRGTVLESPAPEIARGVFWLQSIDAFVVSWTQRREDRETGESGRRAVGRAGSDAGRAALGGA